MAKAKTWAHHLVQRNDWLVIDVETTGLGAHAEIVIAGLPPVVCTWECAMTRYEQWRGFHASLDTACEVESIVVDGTRHRALPDATLVWRLIQRMAGRSA